MVEPMAKGPGLLRSEALTAGFTIDSHCYPNVAYRGPRMQPTEWHYVESERELELRERAIPELPTGWFLHKLQDYRTPIVYAGDKHVPINWRCELQWADKGGHLCLGQGKSMHEAINAAIEEIYLGIETKRWVDTDKLKEAMGL